MTRSELNNEALLSDINIHTNDKLKCFLFKGNKFICLQGVVFPFFFSFLKWI